MSTTRPTTTRAVHLASRPHGAPTEDNFRIEEISLPELSDGQILVANDVMSVDPYMRGRMNDVKSYVPPFHIDRPLDGVPSVPSSSRAARIFRKVATSVTSSGGESMPSLTPVMHTSLTPTSPLRRHI